MGRTLSNMAITDLALKPPGTLKELARAAGVRGALVREHGEEILLLVRELVERAQKGELKSDTEEQRGPKDANRRRREEALKTWRSQKATARKVTPSVVLPNALFDSLLARPPARIEELHALPYFGDKRVQLYGPELLELLAQYPLQE